MTAKEIAIIIKDCTKLDKKGVISYLYSMFIEEKKKTKDKDIVDSIIKVVINYYKLTEDEFQSKCRKGEIVKARQVAMYFCKQFEIKSLTYYGKRIGGKVYQTVQHGIETVKNLRDTDKYFRKELVEIENLINV